MVEAVRISKEGVVPVEDIEAHEEVENIVGEVVESRAIMNEEEVVVATQESSTLLAKALMVRNQLNSHKLPTLIRKVDTKVTIDLQEWILAVKTLQRKNQKNSP